MSRRSSRPEDGRTDSADGQCLRHVDDKEAQVATAEARADELALAALRSSESSVQLRPWRLATHVGATRSVRGK